MRILMQQKMAQRMHSLINQRIFHGQVACDSIGAMKYGGGGVTA